MNAVIPVCNAMCSSAQATALATSSTVRACFAAPTARWQPMTRLRAQGWQYPAGGGDRPGPHMSESSQPGDIELQLGLNSWLNEHFYGPK